MAGMKRFRVFLALVFTSFLILMFKSKSNEAGTQSSQLPNNVITAQHLGDASLNIDTSPHQVEIPILDDNLEIQPPPPPPPPPLLPQAQLIPDAHKLATSDDFIPHFAAITGLKGISQREARVTCTWPADTYVNFQFSDSLEWVIEDRPVLEIELRRREWHDFIRGKMIPYASVKDSFRGRGLVIVAGNADTVMRVKVILRQLKKLSSTLPVEIHY
ncbi:uncharacterized protein ColSpa_10229 [Colletotrichum spaethianum]|uniref:Uncharacterized protein n=1 Tax=Colletotrichum spaethianum TaxID=700344 RepID=A0AA37PD20_9PEZI|nr:uncharacterized protein ColSpa_10229 [Colletotrichum spaethianum]GKT50048.1 hypothetical protein ColSpa_10229 [Colletotrichum spaethianum]